MIPIPDEQKRSDVNLIFGKRGYGKSLLTKTEILSQHPRVIILDPLCEYDGCFTEHFYTLNDLYNYIQKNKVYRVSCSDISKSEGIAQIVFENGDIHLIVEEAQAVLPISQEPLSPVWSNIILRGRHKRVEFTAIAQRPSLVHINLRAQGTVLRIFYQNEPRDLRWIEQVSGLRPEQVNTLKKGEYYEIRSGDYEKKKLTNISI